MKAKCCDRCNKFYDFEEKFEKKIVLKSYSKTKSKYIFQVDLCPACQKSLEEWFEKGQEVGE